MRNTRYVRESVDDKLVLDQITPLILTYNEAPNLERTLRQLSWAKDIVVVDSFSDDETTRIASGYSQARICQRAFDSHRNQWSFGLHDTGIKSPWVLAMDADYVLTDELIAELQALNPESTVNGYRADFVYCLNGKRLRSGIYPSVTVLYRTASAEYIQDGHTHRVRIDGNVGHLRSKILHDDRKPLSRWLRSQVSYAELEAKKLLASRTEPLSVNDRLRMWKVIAPSAVLLYCLIIRGGLLDGWAGLFYAFQRAMAELILSLFLIEARLTKREIPSGNEVSTVTR
ncbi:MAG TPA: glycosyltransferase family 2 protein [Pyrinomonadaceae bacterium]